MKERKLRWEFTHTTTDNLLQQLGFAYYTVNPTAWASLEVYVGNNIIPKLEKSLTNGRSEFKSISEDQLIELIGEDIKNILLKNHEHDEYVLKIVIKSVIDKITDGTDIHRTGEYNIKKIIEDYFQRIIFLSELNDFETEIEDENLKDRLSHLVETYLSTKKK